MLRECGETNSQRKDLTMCFGDYMDEGQGMGIQASAEFGEAKLTIDEGSQGAIAGILIAYSNAVNSLATLQKELNFGQDRKLGLAKTSADSLKNTQKHEERMTAQRAKRAEEQSSARDFLDALFGAGSPF